MRNNTSCHLYWELLFSLVYQHNGNTITYRIFLLTFCAYNFFIPGIVFNVTLAGGTGKYIKKLRVYHFVLIQYCILSLVLVILIKVFTIESIKNISRGCFFMTIDIQS